MAQIPYTAILAATLVAAAVVVTTGGQARAGLTAAQQAKANAALLGLWTNAPYQVSVAEVKVALIHGAYVDARRSNGDTSLAMAVESSNVDVLKFLVSKGADVNSKDLGGSTPLMDAAVNGNVECVRFLVSKGAAVNAKEDYGETPLMYAAVSGSADCMRVLVSRGAEVNSRDSQGSTALMRACCGYPDCVKFLISKGADVNASDNSGRNALSAAHEHKRPDIIALLKAAGAQTLQPRNPRPHYLAFGISVAVTIITCLIAALIRRGSRAKHLTAL